MENSVHLFTFSFLLFVLINIFQKSKQDIKIRDLFLLGGAIVLICLSRVDNLIFVPFVGVIIWRKLNSLRAGAIVFAPVAVVMGAYFIFNYTTFHVLIPMSGEVKAVYWEQMFSATYPSRFDPAYIFFTAQSSLNQVGVLMAWIVAPLFLSPGLFLITIPLFIIFICAVTFVVARHLLLRSNRHKRLSLWWLAVLTVGIAVHVYAFYWELGQYNVDWQRWYYSPEIIISIIWITLGLNVITTKRFILYAIAIYLIVALVISVQRNTSSFGSLSDNPSLYSFYQGASALDQRVPEATIAGSWSSGVIGYFTNTTVINLDGLMNGVDRLNAIRNRIPIRDYLSAHHITYLIDYTATPPETLSPTDSVFGLKPGEFQVVWSQKFLDNEEGFWGYLLIVKVNQQLTYARRLSQIEFSSQ